MWLLDAKLISGVYSLKALNTGVNFLQESFCTFSWWDTLPSGMKTSTGFTSRSRLVLMMYVLYSVLSVIYSCTSQLKFPRGKS